MNSLLRFLERYHFLILFIVLEGFSIWLLAGTNYYQKASFGNFSRGIINAVDNQINRFNEYLGLRQSNIKLVMENVALKNEISKLQNKVESNHQTYLDSIGKAKFTYMPARVINNSVNRQNNYLTLNVGSDQGVKPEMGVVTSKGIVGIVASVSSNFSTVISLLNTNLKVSAKHKRTGFFGSLYWDGLNYREVVLNEIPQHVDLAVGDTIMTSGYSTIFPENIPIGTIEEYSLRGGNFYFVRVKLLSDFKQIDNVYIIKSLLAAERNLLEKQKGNEQDAN